MSNQKAPAINHNTIQPNNIIQGMRFDQFTQKNIYEAVWALH